MNGLSNSLQRISLTAIILSSASLQLRAALDSSSENAARYKTSAVEAVTRVNTVLGKHHLPLWDTSLTKPAIQTKFDRNRKTQVVKFGGFRVPIEITFLPATTEIIGIMRYGVVTMSSPKYNTPPAPTWTKEKALDVAKEFVVAAIGEFPSDAAEPIVIYKDQLDLPKYLDGKWFVSWPRRDSKGRMFKLDSVNVQINEKLGPVGMGYNFFSHYQERDFEPITREKALDLALPRVQEVMEWSPVKGRFREFVVTGQPQAELWIVNPNRITELTSIDDLALAHDTNARLAWVISYSTTYGGSRDGKGVIPVDGQIDVWIDAEDGTFIGGDIK